MLKSKLKRLIVSVLPASIVYKIRKSFFHSSVDSIHKEIGGDARATYSQEGEDLLIERIMGSQSQGFYVDIGAHHPTRFSNTFLLYQRGWSGINVDAMPDSMLPFRQLRPRDINLEIAIASKETVLDYHIFNEPALNTFSSVEASKKNGLGGYKITDVRKIRTRTLASVLDEFLPEGVTIDLLTIDVEGLDYDVLVSNNWQKYRPRLILVEDLTRNLEEILEESRVLRFLRDRNYKLFAKTYNTSFYLSKE